MAIANCTFAVFLYPLVDAMILSKFAVSLYTNMYVENSSSCSGKLQWPVKVSDVTTFWSEADSVLLLLITEVS